MATWCKELTHWKRPSLMLQKIEGRRRGWQKMRWLNGNIDTMDMSLIKFQETVKDRETWHATVPKVKKSCMWLSTEQQQRRTFEVGTRDTGASEVALVVKNPPTNAGDQGFDPWVRKILWRRKWQPSPVFLPRESHGQKSLAGYSLLGRKESDIAEAT